MLRGRKQVISTKISVHVPAPGRELRAFGGFLSGLYLARCGFCSGSQSSRPPPRSPVRTLLSPQPGPRGFSSPRRGEPTAAHRPPLAAGTFLGHRRPQISPNGHTACCLVPLFSPSCPKLFPVLIFIHFTQFLIVIISSLCHIPLLKYTLSILQHIYRLI